MQKFFNIIDNKNILYVNFDIKIIENKLIFQEIFYQLFFFLYFLLINISFKYYFYNEIHKN